jgi:hypothetical protein
MQFIFSLGLMISGRTRSLSSGAEIIEISYIL